MLPVADALREVLARCSPLSPQVAPLSSDTLGLLLAEDVVAADDSPPFSKSLMDGYAVRHADLAAGAPLRVTQEIPAGRPPKAPLGPGEAARILTGGELPEGADCVVMQEHARREGDAVTLDDPKAAPGRHVLPRGAELRRGDAVLKAGTALRPQEFGLLATAGRTAFSAFPRPRVAVIATGDEVVEASARLRRGQVRNSNGPMLVAQITRAGGLPRYLGIARDDRAWLRSYAGEALDTADALILSGGVSVGDRDLVPGVLRELGVVEHFHHVAMKPGKPLFFGSRGKCLVFGLPGNPVSAFAGFELFVRPAIQRMRGFADPGPRRFAVRLAEPFSHRSDRPTWYPARLELRGPTWHARPVAWLGSADLRAITDADTLLELPVGETTFASGDEVSALWLEA